MNSATKNLNALDEKDNQILLDKFAEVETSKGLSTEYIKRIEKLEDCVKTKSLYFHYLTPIIPKTWQDLKGDCP